MALANGVARGRIVDALAPGEDSRALHGALQSAADWILTGRVRLLLHDDQRDGLSDAERAARRDERRARLRARKLKRYVFALDTAAGKRIVKIVESQKVGDQIAGWCVGSGAQREHHNQLRATALGLAETRTCGYLEWRRGGLLLRSAQIQEPLADDALTLDCHLAGELRAHGLAAVEPLAGGLAESHAKGFFHADLKGFHAFVHDLRGAAAGPRHYSLRWLDLGRVAFRLTRRRRLINLYQMLRFVLPQEEAARLRFIDAYCQASGWSAAHPQQALAKVMRLLNYKLRTHPNPYL